MKTIQQIDQKLAKKTFFRYVKYGNFEEVYEYEKPIFYNLPPTFTTERKIDISDSRRDDNLYYSRLKINRLVLANTNWKNCAPRFVTFTFARNITNLQEANRYWANFIREFKKERKNLQYLGVVEFQKRGAVHYHVLFFNLKYEKKIKEKIAKQWGQGFIKFKSAKRIEKIEHLGLYLAKYLQKDILDIRLKGQKAFFTSKNLVQPLILRNNDTCRSILDDMVGRGATMVSYETSHFGKIKKYSINNYASSN